MHWRSNDDGKCVLHLANRPLKLPGVSIIQDLSPPIAGVRPLPTAFLTAKRIPWRRRPISISGISGSLMIEWE